MNKSYTKEQRLRDRKVYSRGAERRINKRMNEGYSIQAARSEEAKRLSRIRNISNTTRKVGSVAGAVAGFAASNHIINAVNKATKYKYYHIMNDPINSMLISGGIAKVAQDMGRYAGTSIPMLLGGYDPEKYR